MDFIIHGFFIRGSIVLGFFKRDSISLNNSNLNEIMKFALSQCIVICSSIIPDFFLVTFAINEGVFPVNVQIFPPSTDKKTQ